MLKKKKKKKVSYYFEIIIKTFRSEMEEKRFPFFHISDGLKQQGSIIHFSTLKTCSKKIHLIIF